MRGHIRERSGPSGPAFEVRVKLDGKAHTRTVRWRGAPPKSKAAMTRARAEVHRRAEAELTRLLAELDDGQHRGPDGTVAALLERWLRLRGPGWADTTRVEHERIVDTYLTPRIGDLRLSALDPQVIDDCYGALSTGGGRGGRPLSAATVQRIHVVLHSALEQAVRWGWLARNPADRVSPPRPQRRPTSSPEVKAVNAVMARAAELDPTLAAYVRLAAVTGARRGELLGLRWGDLAGSTLTIARSWVQPTGQPARVAPTKTRRVRVIALDAETVKLLSRHRVSLKRQARICGVDYPPDGPLFPADPAGSRPAAPDSMSRRVQRAAKAQGVPGVTIRQLRHFAATQMLANGIPVHTAAERLGHARASTTFDIYGHALQPHDSAAAETLAATLKGSSG